MNAAAGLFLLLAVAFAVACVYLFSPRAAVGVVSLVCLLVAVGLLEDGGSQ